MIEYSDFYENMQAVGESLQCPRCSATVPANPSVCSNCGEKVFQCHKCRAINYDEKDPFFCNSCGFCKYAKFEYSRPDGQALLCRRSDRDGGGQEEGRGQYQLSPGEGRQGVQEPDQ